MTFPATSGVPYHLWARLRAQGNSFDNDSVHLQFDDAVNQLGNPLMRIGTTASAEMLLQDGPNGAADHGWGWADNGWGASGKNIYFAASGIHRIRVQQREDGAMVDQIVLSPDQYLTLPPGPRRDDTTVLTTTGTACPVTLSPNSIYVGRLLATWSIAVASSCTWTARTDFDWLELKDPVAGLFVHGIDLTFTGSATIRVHALPNAGAKRTGYFLIGGQKEPR